MVNVLVTGGAGFIGSNFVRYALAAHPDWRVTTLDKLTYAGRLENLKGVMDNPRHRFVKGDVADAAVAAPLVKDVRHRRPLRRRDARRPIDQERRRLHHDRRLRHVRAARGGAREPEAAALRPDFDRRGLRQRAGGIEHARPTSSGRAIPYSASKAGADRLAYSYWATYQVPVVITRASNNYGPNQFPEKIIPLFITNLIDDIPVPLYGDGQNERDWLHVDDHCRGVDLLIDKGAAGEVYNIGGGNEVKNVDLTHRILELVGKPASLIKPVADRPGHDRRYSLDTVEARSRSAGSRGARFEQGLAETVAWYRRTSAWWRPIKDQDPEFRKYYQAQYGNRS